MDRRSFLTGLGALIAAPSIVSASSLMPVRRALLVPEPVRSYEAGRMAFADGGELVVYDGVVWRAVGSPGWRHWSSDFR